MLFHSSLRQELARSFGATLIVLVTVVMTMTLIRTLGQAALGHFNPQDVSLIMGYTVLAYMPTLLTLSLLLAVVGTLARWQRDSELVIWMSSGLGLARWLAPVWRFAWPVWLAVAVLALVAVPWCNQRIDQLKAYYEQRGDLDRVQPGQFQESSDGDKVFFVERNPAPEAVGSAAGQHVFIATREKGLETVTSAQSGRITSSADGRYLELDRGQRLERDAAKGTWKLSTFERYAVRVSADPGAASEVAVNTLSSVALLRSATPAHLAELSWRLGLVWAAFNLSVLALAASTTRPRVARAGQIGLAFFAFVVYFNLLGVGQSWVAAARVDWRVWMLALHGSVLALSLLWLAQRHHAWHWRHWLAAAR